MGALVLENRQELMNVFHMRVPLFAEKRAYIRTHLHKRHISMYIVHVFSSVISMLLYIIRCSTFLGVCVVFIFPLHFRLIL